MTKLTTNGEALEAQQLIDPAELKRVIEEAINTQLLCSAAVHDDDQRISPVDTVNPRNGIDENLIRLQRQLANTQQTLKNIRNGVGLGLIIVNTRHEVQSFNDQAVRYFGLVDKDIGSSLLGIPSHFPIPKFSRLLDSVIRAGLTKQRTIVRDNAYIVLQIAPYRDENEHVVGAVLSFIDCSEHYATENQLRLIGDTLEEVVWMTDSDGKVLHISPGYETVWGHSPEAFLRDPQQMIAAVHPDDAARVNLAIIQWSEAPLRLTYRIIDAHGNEKWIREKRTMVGNSNGSPGYVIGTASDITDAVDAERQHKVSAARFSAVFETMAMAIALVDIKGRIFLVNNAFVKWLGYERKSDLHGRSLSEITDPDDRFMSNAMFEEMVAGVRTGYLLDRRFITCKGDTSWGRVSTSMAGNPNHSDRFSVVVVENIDESKQRESLSFQNGNYDALTGLPNRALLLDRLQTQLLRAQRSHSKTFVLFIDLDGFKEVNDTQGHEVGDTVLREIANRFSGVCRASDTLARFGGDEFVAIVCDIEQTETVERIARGLLDEARLPIETPTGPITLSASIGISCNPDDSDTPMNLIQFSDTAMYNAKASGRDGLRFYSPRMNNDASKRVRVKQDLQRALAQGHLVYELQPLVRLSDHKVMGAEMLVRLNEPGLGMVMPAEFIPVAEESRLIDEVGNWVLDSAGRLLKEWRSANRPRLVLSFNASARQFENGLLFERLDMWAPVAPNLIMEITERALLEPGRKTLEAIDTFRANGGRIALDDFGTGYSGLGYLRDFPIDIVKLDGVFMSKAHDQDRNYKLIEALINLTKAMDATVIIEGVESAAQLEFLSRFEDIWVQGYEVFRPMNRQQFDHIQDRARLH